MNVISFAIISLDFCEHHFLCYNQPGLLWTSFPLLFLNPLDKKWQQIQSSLISGQLCITFGVSGESWVDGGIKLIPGNCPPGCLCLPGPQQFFLAFWGCMALLDELYSGQRCVCVCVCMRVCVHACVCACVCVCMCVCVTWLLFDRR